MCRQRFGVLGTCLVLLTTLGCATDPVVKAQDQIDTEDEVLHDSDGRISLGDANFLSQENFRLRLPGSRLRPDYELGFLNKQRDYTELASEGATLAPFSVRKYSGLWYEAATSFIPRNTFEALCECTQAVYNLVEAKEQIPEDVAPSEATENPSDGLSGLGLDTANLRNGVKRHLVGAVRLPIGNSQKKFEGPVVLQGMHRCQRGRVADFGMYIELRAASPFVEGQDMVLERGELYLSPNKVGDDQDQEEEPKAGISSNYWVVAMGDVREPLGGTEEVGDDGEPIETIEMDGFGVSLAESDVDGTYAIAVAPPPVPLPLSASMGIWVLVRDPRLAKFDEFHERLLAEADRLEMPRRLFMEPLLSRTNHDPQICQRFYKLHEEVGEVVA